MDSEEVQIANGQKKKLKVLKYSNTMESLCNTVMVLLVVILVFLLVLFVLDLNGIIRITTLFAFTAPGTKQPSPSLNLASTQSANVQSDFLANPFEGNPVQVDEIIATAAIADEIGEDLFQNSDEQTVTPDPEMALQEVIADSRQMEERVSLIQISKNRRSSKRHTTHHRKRQPINQQQHRLARPDVDHKEYRFIELPNRLKVLLIHDDQAELSSISMNVEVGSWHEPQDFPGLAHLLEHSVFQGSRTYPQKNYFDNLISEGGGEYNAYTENHNTNFYYTVNAKNLERSLQAFSHFFIDPLLEKDKVYSEIQAVNDEYEMDMSDDSWKIMNLLSLFSDKEHPNSRFNIGNVESLKKEGVVKALKEFFREKYSSNLMSLVVKTSKDLDYLEQFMLQSDFDLIGDLDLNLEESYGQPIKEKASSVVKFKVDQNEKSVILCYQLPGKSVGEYNKPVQFLDGFTENIKKYIVDQGFGMDLTTELLVSEKDYQMYLIEVSLNQENKFDFDQRDLSYRFAKVVSNYYQELEKRFLNEDGTASEYLKEEFAEMQQLMGLEFKYLQDDGDVSVISQRLQENKFEEILSGDYTVKELDVEAIKSYLDAMKQPTLIMVADNDYSEQMQSTLKKQESFVQKGSSRQDLQFLSNNRLGKRDALLNVDYSIKKLDKSTVEFIRKVDKNIVGKMHFNEKNDYIPQNLQLVSVCKESARQEDVLQEDHAIELNHETLQTMSRKEVYSFLDVVSLEEVSEAAERTADLEMFTQLQESVDYFASMDQCKRKELEYDVHNHYPVLLRQKENKVWWKLDRSFEIPQVFAGVHFESHDKLTAVKDKTILNLYAFYYNQLLHSKQPESAGYEFSVQPTFSGMALTLQGWSDQFDRYFNHVLKSLNDNTDQSLFDIAKSQYTNYLQDQYQQVLYQQALSIYLPSLLVHPYSNPNQLLAELHDLNYDQFKSYKLFNHFNYQTLFLGNIDKQQSISLSHSLADLLHTKTQSNTHSQHIINLKDKSIIYAAQSQSSDYTDDTGVTLNYYQIGKRDSEQYGATYLLTGIINTQSYNILRHKMQLGYLVQASIKPVGCVDGMFIIVQGSKLTPYQVNQKIENFLIQLEKQLKKMPESYFENLKQGAVIQQY